MVSGKEIKLVDLKRKSDERFCMVLQLGNKHKSYDVSITDREGVFGVEFPDDLGLDLRSLPVEVNRNLLKAVKQQHQRMLQTI